MICQDTIAETKVRINNLKLYKHQQERVALQNKSYSKQLNILNHGIEEDNKSVQET